MPGFGRKVPAFGFQKITLILWEKVVRVASNCLKTGVSGFCLSIPPGYPSQYINK
jgi:hypothetical protein